MLLDAREQPQPSQHSVEKCSRFHTRMLNRTAAPERSSEVTSALRSRVVYAPFVRVVRLRQEVGHPAAAAVLRPAVHAAIPAARGRPKPAGHAPHDSLRQQRLSAARCVVPRAMLCGQGLIVR